MIYILEGFFTLSIEHAVLPMKLI